MTLKDFKKENQEFVVFKDNELIKIFNEVLGVTPEINSMDYEISEEAVMDKVKYSPQVINFIVEKKLSNNNLSPEKKIQSILKDLKKLSEEANKKTGLEEEKKYINQMIENLNKDMKMHQQMGSFLEKNKELLTKDVDMKNLTQEQIAFMILFQPEKMKGYNISVEQIKTNEIKPEVEAFMPPPPPNIEPISEEVKIPGPTAATPQVPQAAKNSLQDLKNRKIIPSNVTDQQLIDYCCKMFNLDPKKVNMDYVLTSQNIDLLTKSSLMSSSEIKSNIHQEHQVAKDQYQELIDNYEKMLDGMKNTPEFAEDAKQIEELIGRLKTEQKNHGDKLDSLQEQDLEAFFEYGSSGLKGARKGISDMSKSIVTHQEERLTEIDQKYANLAAKKERLESLDPQFFGTKIKNNINIAVLSARMDRLRHKQGRIQVNQKRLVDANSQMYIQKQEENFKKYMKQQEKMHYDVQRKQNKVEDLNYKKSKVDMLNKKIVSLEEKKKTSGELRKVSINNKQTRLENRRARIERGMKRLEGKIGNMNLSQQYQTTFDQSYAYAM